MLYGPLNQNKINQTQLLYKTIEAVQALIAENDALKARIEALEG
jgi:hypothetical protein